MIWAMFDWFRGPYAKVWSLWCGFQLKSIFKIYNNGFTGLIFSVHIIRSYHLVFPTSIHGLHSWHKTWSITFSTDAQTQLVSYSLFLFVRTSLEKLSFNFHESNLKIFIVKCMLLVEMRFWQKGFQPSGFLLIFICFLPLIHQKKHHEIPSSWRKAKLYLN